MAVMAGEWEIFTRNWGEARKWVEEFGFIMGKMGNFLHSWQRNDYPISYEDPLYCLSFSFFQILSEIPFHFLVTSNPHSHCSFHCPVSFVEWMITPHLMCYFT